MAFFRTEFRRVCPASERGGDRERVRVRESEREKGERGRKNARKWNGAWPTRESPQSQRYYHMQVMILGNSVEKWSGLTVLEYYPVSRIPYIVYYIPYIAYYILYIVYNAL